MRSLTQVSPDSSSEFHLSLGGGGSRATLAVTGGIAAFHMCRWTNWKSITVTSGGSVPGTFFAGHDNIKNIVRLALHTDFSQMVTPKVGKLKLIWAMLNKYRYEIQRPLEGVLSPELLKQFVNNGVPTWPENLIITGTDQDNQELLLTHAGVFRSPAGARRIETISDKPIDLGTAVTISCAIPGIIDGARAFGENMFDGGLGVEGQCPITPPQKLFGAKPERIIAFDVGEDHMKKDRLVRVLWYLTCRGARCGPLEGYHPTEEDDGIILIAPKITGFNGLKFILNSMEKWGAIVCGYHATIERLERSDLISRETHREAFEIKDELEDLVRRVHNQKHCAKRIERLFRNHGMY